MKKPLKQISVKTRALTAEEANAACGGAGELASLPAAPRPPRPVGGDFFITTFAYTPNLDTSFGESYPIAK